MLTPLEHYPKLAEKLGLTDLYFKREDMHPYGSHKGRSIPVMIDKYLADGDRHFAISSSGNAALAAALYIRELNENTNSKKSISKNTDHKIDTKDETVKLDIFVGIHIDEYKLEKLKKLVDENIRVLAKERPLQALTQAVEEGARSLRQSTDDTALLGYEELAEELIGNRENGSGKNIKIGAIFIGTSSGTTAQALAEYFLKNKSGVQVHIVQTSSCHPIADAFDTFDVPDERSIADAIIGITAQRKSVLVPLIKETGGRGWCATNDDILSAQEMVKKETGLDISTNSALSVVGALQASYMGYEIDGATVCMICGD